MTPRRHQLPNGDDATVVYVTFYGWCWSVAMDAHFTCVCRSILVVRFFSTNRRSRGSMALPQTAHTTGADFLNHIASSRQRPHRSRSSRIHLHTWPTQGVRPPWVIARRH